MAQNRHFLRLDSGSLRTRVFRMSLAVNLGDARNFLSKTLGTKQTVGSAEGERDRSQLREVPSTIDMRKMQIKSDSDSKLGILDPRWRWVWHSREASGLFETLNRTHRCWFVFSRL